MKYNLLIGSSGVDSLWSVGEKCPSPPAAQFCVVCELPMVSIVLDD